MLMGNMAQVREAFVIGQIVDHIEPHEPIAVPMPKRWFIRKTAPNREFKVLKRARQLGLSAYLPTLTSQREYRRLKRRWPTNASDDQHRVDNAWWSLSNEEGEAALVGISPFLDKLKRDHRKHPPAGFTYLNQKRWTLIEQAIAATAATPSEFDINSREGKAIAILFDLAGKRSFFQSVICKKGVVYERAEITPQLLALADLPPRSEWLCQLSYEQAGAWNRFFRARFGDRPFIRVVEGSVAPKPWPPNKKGDWPPEFMNNEDFEALSNEGQK